MAYDSLADFVSELQDDGDLVRIAAEVDSHLELAAVTDRICKLSTAGPAVFFENVKGRSMPVVANLLGSRRRMCKALGAASFDEVAARIAGLIHPEVPEGWLETLKLVPQMTQWTRLPPQTVKTGACQQVVKMGRDVDLHDLPIPHCWPDDGGPTITAGQVFTHNPETGVRNVGLYTLEVRGRDLLAVHWNAHQGGYHNFLAYKQQRRQMPIAVALGGDPVCTYVASTPFPANVDECLLGGFLRRQSIDLVRCRSVELEVPAHADIVLEGLIDTAGAPETAGPVGQSTGFYSLAGERPLMQVTALTHRSNPMFPVMIPGRPPMEEFWLRKATERIFLPFIRLSVPEIIDLHLPVSGAFRNLLFVSIRKEYPGQARKVMHSLWGLNELMVSKIIVVVDEDVDVRNEEQVWFFVGANTHPGRDVIFCEGPTHESDHAAPIAGMGHKMGIDATSKLPEEGHLRPWPKQLQMPREIKELIDRRWSEYGFRE
jgi:4-hydroxy-3-polyprenylbenzoate decarboxylase